MASQYTGNPSVGQSPSPAPSWGSNGVGDPIGNLPADGDTFNASAFLQAYKVALDWIAFFRRQVPLSITAAITSALGTLSGVAPGTIAQMGCTASNMLTLNFPGTTCKILVMKLSVSATTATITLSGDAAFSNAVYGAFITNAPGVNYIDGATLKAGPTSTQVVTVNATWSQGGTGGDVYLAIYGR
jgi:hypothetical protein